MDAEKENFAFFWKDTDGKHLHNFTNLIHHLREDEKKLTYTMTGGMYLNDGIPQGLYIEKVLLQNHSTPFKRPMAISTYSLMVFLAFKKTENQLLQQVNIPQLLNQILPLNPHLCSSLMVCCNQLSLKVKKIYTCATR
jgi:hypothetical protein